MSLALDLSDAPPDRREGGLADLMTMIAARAAEAEIDPGGLGPEITAMARAGLLSACLPRPTGGSGLAQDADQAEALFDALRRLGRANLSAARLFEGHVNAIRLVGLYGGAAIQTQVYDAVRSGALLGVWGADGARPLTYVRAGGRWILHGEKLFASGLGQVRYAVATVREKGAGPGPAELVLVDVSDPARQEPEQWTASGMRATASGRFRFDGLEVGAEHRLGSPGDYQREPHFEGGVWRYCAAHLGGAEALVDLWRGALSSRGRLDEPLQLTRLGRAAALCRAMSACIHAAAVRVETCDPDDQHAVPLAVADVLLARQFTEEACVEVLVLAEKSLGTMAHGIGSPIERVRRDLSLFIRQAAPDAKLIRAVQSLDARWSDAW
ncbi:hypothetical protein [Brevundimonas diminuta]|jgi:alkylation response protein AidB-like acyl-CoA dehydrogenase|uniref:hypothetical protein n=1 Tax=Brevundimonas diminuta TaxID=293 RepID=UPI0035E00406